MIEPCSRTDFNSDKDPFPSVQTKKCQHTSPTRVITSTLSATSSSASTTPTQVIGEDEEPMFFPHHKDEEPSLLDFQPLLGPQLIPAPLFSPLQLFQLQPQRRSNRFLCLSISLRFSAVIYIGLITALQNSSLTLIPLFGED